MYCFREEQMWYRLFVTINVQGNMLMYDENLKACFQICSVSRSSHFDTSGQAN